MNPAITDICQKVRISDYLMNRGVSLQRAGKRQKCCCPIHSEKTASFWITTMPDGAELFKCFGCDRGGNIITLMAEMEKTTNGAIVKNLASRLKIKLGKWDEAERVTPLNDEILEYFCCEDEMLLEMADFVVPFLAKNPTQDAVNKISRVYEQIDKCAVVGDSDGILGYIKDILKVTSSYAAVEMEGENAK